MITKWFTQFSKQTEDNYGSNGHWFDSQHSTVNISDDSKVFVQYHPFGTTSYRSGANEVDVSLKRYKYCGKERDEETGLYYYGMRYYAAWLCRFINVDPLQFKYPYYTPFQYAGNMPITYIDLDGGEPKPLLKFNPQEFNIYGEPYYHPVDNLGGNGGTTPKVIQVKPIKKTPPQTNAKPLNPNVLKDPQSLIPKQVYYKTSVDPTGGIGNIYFQQQMTKRITKLIFKQYKTPVNTGEILPIPSEFERKVDETYKSTGEFENTYRYDIFLKASATGLFLTGTFATGAYFAPTLKYSATNLFINSYQSGTTLYNSASYLLTTPKGIYLEGFVWGLTSTLTNTSSPDIELTNPYSTLFAVPVSFTTMVVLDLIKNNNQSMDSFKIDSTKFELKQKNKPIVIPEFKPLP